ncbi:side tail fiber protein [Escherichia phage HK106]|uniref:Side tail fiber protein n=2 Tax=root TaxID=1 RepID=K7P7Q7_9CAUD|nr:tail fiber protein [Escherichia phage HK106]AFH20712.1 side tail fiber protein [Escherichia phage HK106]
MQTSPRRGFLLPGENMLYNTGTIAINGNSATGTGTNWTAPASQVRAGQTIIVMSNPVQLFQISSVNSATSMTVTPAASPALSGQKYGILVSDNISVDGLALAMSQLIKEYDENIGAWETFATTSANQSITVTINGTAVTIPGIGKLAQKGSNGAVTVADGGTGATNAADARTNLGLGEGSALPVGVPVPWPSATPPTGWLKCNGAVFSAEEYPELAKAYPTNKLPDLRGEFIRGWDDGRGVDSGRALLSAQGDAIRDISGKLLGLMTTAGSQMTADEWVTGAFNAVYEGGAGQTTSSPGSRYDVGFSAARVVPTAEENRPRNIAFNYIVRAS